VVDINKFYEGTTLGMAGDSMRIGFNVPFAQSDVAQRAVLCVRVMMAHIAPMQAIGWGTHAVDVGMSRGSAIFGNVEALSHMAYTLIGDAVNVAARLTQLAKWLNG
jgi:adenylate cyclase